MKIIRFIILVTIFSLLSACLNIEPIKPQPIPEIYNQNEDILTILNQELKIKNYSQAIGRTELNSRRTYTFSLPVDVHYNLIGEDASSGYFEFIKDNAVIFKMATIDYKIGQELIAMRYPHYQTFSIVAGHTNIVELRDQQYQSYLKIFIDSLRIDGQKVFL